MAETLELDVEDFSVRSAKEEKSLIILLTNLLNKENNQLTSTFSLHFLLNTTRTDPQKSPDPISGTLELLAA